MAFLLVLCFCCLPSSPRLLRPSLCMSRFTWRLEIGGHGLGPCASLRVFLGRFASSSFVLVSLAAVFCDDYYVTSDSLLLRSSAFHCVCVLFNVQMSSLTLSFFLSSPQPLFLLFSAFRRRRCAALFGPSPDVATVSQTPLADAVRTSSENAAVSCATSEKWRTLSTTVLGCHL